MRSRFVIPAAILVAAAYVKGRQDAHLVAPGPPSLPGPTDESILRAQAEAADAWEIGLDDAAGPRLAEAESAAAAAAVAPAGEAPAAVEDDLEDEPDAGLDAEPDAGLLADLDDDPVAVEDAPAPPPVWIPDFDAVLVPEAAPTVFAPRTPAWEPDPLTLSEWSGTPAGPAPRVVASGRFALGGSAVQAGHMALCGVTFPARIADEVAAGRIRLVPDALENVSADGLLVLGDGGFAPDADGFTLLVAAEGPGAFAASGRYELIAGTAG